MFWQGPLISKKNETKIMTELFYLKIIHYTPNSKTGIELLILQKGCEYPTKGFFFFLLFEKIFACINFANCKENYNFLLCF